MNKIDMIADLRLKRQAAKNDVEGIVSRARSFNRGLSSGERQTFDAKETEIRGYNERIEELERQQAADDAAAPLQRTYGARAGEGVTRNESTYRKDGQHSYFRDLYRSTKGDASAFDRLRRNNEERAISTTNGNAGEFAPPAWLEDEYIKVARPGRVTANLLPTQELPPGVDVLNVPKINTGTTVGPQAGGQNSAISQTDITTTSIAAPVTTIAGGQTVSLQLLEQSPLRIDNVILSDLAAAYAMTLDQQVINGPGTGGQLTGLMTLSGTHAIDFNPATVSLFGLGGLYSTMANAIQQISSSRYLAPDAIVMHPRRWNWICVQVDNQNRPAVLPHDNGPFNAMGIQTDAVAEGAVGRIMGLPVYLDANIPTNLTADTGTAEDAIIIARLADSMLFEGSVRAEAFQQTYASNLSVFVRLYNYAALVTSRYAPSVAVITGKGLQTPSF